MTIPFPNGYTCARCGAWVAYGTVHDCGSFQAPMPRYPQTYGGEYGVVLAQIAAALERIAKALEKHRGEDDA